MRGLIAAALGAVAMAVTAAVPAQAQAVLVRSHGDWGVYKYKQGGQDVCYALTIPKSGSEQPKTLDHGKVYFFVSQRPGQNVSLEPQFIAGYEIKKDSKVVADVGGKKFNMFTDKSSAWVENAADEPAFVSAMKAGSEMKVSATSKRGNRTSYTFSLKGISAALTSIASCK